MATRTKTELEGIKLIPRQIREADFSIARLLSEQEQQVYEEACKKYSGKAREELNVPKNGSHLFKVLLLNQEGIRTATLPELELVLDDEKGKELLIGHYEDSPSVILRSAGDSYKKNDYLAKSLTKLIRQKKFNNPVIINGLKPNEDKNSAYGLSFGETERIQIIEAPDFNHRNNGRKFSRINPDYTIEFDEQGEGTIHTRSSGLSRLYLDGDLAGSDADGRVVIISGEAIPQNFLGLCINRLKQEKDRQIEQIKERYTKAEAILKGKK